MSDLFNARMMHKRDTEENWLSNDPVILNGEIVFVDTENDGLKIKIGDGIKAYSELSFADEILRSLITAVDSKLFVGTMEAYETADAAGLVPVGALVIITEEEDVSLTTSVLGEAILGEMILGSD